LVFAKTGLVLCPANDPQPNPGTAATSIVKESENVSQVHDDRSSRATGFGIDAGHHCACSSAGISLLPLSIEPDWISKLHIFDIPAVPSHGIRECRILRQESPLRSAGHRRISVATAKGPVDDGTLLTHRNCNHGFSLQQISSRVAVARSRQSPRPRMDPDDPLRRDAIAAVAHYPARAARSSRYDRETRTTPQSWRAT